MAEVLDAPAAPAAKAKAKKIPVFKVGQTALFWDEGIGGLMPYPAIILQVQGDGHYRINVHGEGRLIHYPRIPASAEPEEFHLTALE